MAKRGSCSGGDCDNGFEAWGGYMAAKKAKLEQQFSEAAGRNMSGIFSGVRILVNGLTEPPASQLKQMMLDHGGVYQQYYRSRGSNRTTHIIASNVCQATTKHLGNKTVVRPLWITESITAGKLLDHIPFLLLKPQSSVLDRMVLKDTSSSDRTIYTDLQSNVFSDEGEHEDSNMLCTSPAMSEEHQSISTSPGKTKAAGSSFAGGAEQIGSPIKKAGDVGFLQEYFGKSRLHHISEMKSVFTDYVASLHRNPDACYPGRDELKRWCVDYPDGAPPGELLAGDLVVAHVDMDCFFVSVGLLDRPELIGCPVAVTHCRRGGAATAITAADSDGRGSMAEVASCSYEARAVGVRNGMLMGAALRLCPRLQTIPYNFAAYRRVALSMYSTVASLSGDIQAVSCDELLLDCGQLLRATGASPRQLADYLRHTIREKTGGCTASVGIGPNILVARLATRVAKPSGQLYVSSDEAEGFIANQRLEDLPGVGPSTARTLHVLDATSCLDLRKLSLAQLRQSLGARLGERVFESCRGRDSRRVVPDAARKSISVDVNYGIRFVDQQRLVDFVKEVCQELHRRMLDAKFSGQQLTLKLMMRARDAPVQSAKFMGHGRCDTVSRSSTLPAPVQRLEVLQRQFLSLLSTLHPITSDVRGVALQVSRASSASTTSSHQQAASSAASIADMFDLHRGTSGGRQSPATYELDSPLQYSACSTVVPDPSTARGCLRPAGSSTSTARSRAPMSVQEALLRLEPSSAASAAPTACRPTPTPSFYGCSDTVQISRLIIEWVDSGSTAPQSTDVLAVQRYLAALVDAWLLRQACDMLRLISRRVAVKASSVWSQTLCDIRQHVQRRVVAVHGAPLP